MKSKAQVLRENPSFKSLINAVVSRIGMESIEDVNRHGISGGFSGFIYYSDTVAFYKRYRAIINRMVLDMSKEFGTNPVDFVAGFRCVNDDDENRQDIGVCVYGGNLSKLEDDTHVPNALAWFAAEEVCRMFDND